MSVQTFPIEGGLSSLVGAAPQRLPPAPKTIEATGLDTTFLVELAAKAMFLRGQSSLANLCHQMRLPGLASGVHQQHERAAEQPAPPTAIQDQWQPEHCECQTAWSPPQSKKGPRVLTRRRSERGGA